ncbi:MAG TPA: hypothetical protein VNL38_02110, partial [Candidatus Nitrosotenuis sp.]|nr:hypothetical protein [Candidatus Nitrosotenuis sp.]
FLQRTHIACCLASALSLASLAFAQKPQTWRNKEVPVPAKFERVLIFPPEVQWLQSTATDTRAMGGVSAELAARLGATLAEQFANQHVEAAALEGEATSQEAAGKVEALLARMQTRFRQASSVQVSRQPLQEFNVNSELGELWPLLGAAKPDALVISFAFGRDTTRGGAIAGSIGSVFADEPVGKNRLLLRLGFVDAGSGRMISFCQLETKEGVLNNSEPLHAAVARCVQIFLKPEGAR